MKKPECLRLNVSDVCIEYSLTGEGNRSIALINGFRMPFNSWNMLYPDIEQFGRIFAYNRPGVGNSSKATSDQTGTTVVETLRNLLSLAGIFPPYVLVAHSLGGLFANLYACMYPEEVSALVLVEATHPNEPKKQRELPPHPALISINHGLKSIERLLDEYKYSEDEKIDETINQINRAQAFPQIPLAVVSGTKKMPFVPQKNFEIHLQFQRELLALSSHSKHYLAQRSGHFPQLTEPEIVLAAIKDVLGVLKTA